MTTARILDNLTRVRDRIAEAARRSGRLETDLTLVAVTKRHPPGPIRDLVSLGPIDLGENYPQELWAKAEALADLPVRWHLIGHLQGNKVRKTVPLVAMIHGVDSLKLLRTLDDLAASLDQPPRVCLQVNISGEESKHGWSPDQLFADAQAIAGCRSLPIIGLMTIAGYGTSNEEARPTFRRLREVRDQLQTRTGMPLPELSMGMSNDYEAAVEEGATYLRVGSALFDEAGG